MRADKKAERAMANLAKLLEKHNALPDNAKELATGNQTVIRQVTREALATERKPAAHYTAEAVLLFLQKPAAFTFKHCKWCGEAFGTNYRSVAYCSNSHRAMDLQRVGLEWDPSKPEERRWGWNDQMPVEPPLLIPPKALSVLLELARLQQNNPEQFASVHWEPRTGTQSASAGASSAEVSAPQQPQQISTESLDPQADQKTDSFSTDDLDWLLG